MSLGSRNAYNKIMTSDEFLSGPNQPDPPSGADDGSNEDPARSSFADLPLPVAVRERLAQLGFHHPTPIQELAIPVAVKGIDLIGKAETGTGKTIAFTAPIIGKLDPERVAVQALVLCPTRELAQQVEKVASAVGETLGIRVALVVGGVHQSQQILQLRSGAQMVVGTPGRVLDFLRSGKIRLGWAEQVVLDEADRMLDMGFIDDVSEILEHTSSDRQTYLFSATLPPKIRTLMKRFMKNPQIVSTILELATVPEIEQKFIRCEAWAKKYWVHQLLDQNKEETCIIFCNTRRAVIDLDRDLWGRGYPAGSLHGEHDQDRRFNILEGFKKKQITTMVATDVAARGLDVEAVTRVVNYDIPDEVETYVHRIGRTGRAGALGLAISLVDSRARFSWNRIVEETGFPIAEETWQPPRGARPDPNFNSRTTRGGPRGRPRGGAGKRPGGPSSAGRRGNPRGGRRPSSGGRRRK
ncbi:MAG: DEAD/DEAH box helicase [Planctomycetota bacterium]